MLFSYLIIGIVLLIGFNLSFFSPFKNAFKDFSYLDLYYSEKLNESKLEVNKDIILVNVDRLSRKKIGELVHALKNFSPKIIGLDIIFKDLEYPDWDQYLGKELENDSIVFASTIIDGTEVITNPLIYNTKGSRGYSNFNFDNESTIIRNFQGLKQAKTELLVSFPVLIVDKYLKGSWLSKHKSFLKKEQPINYTGKRDNFLILENEDIVGKDTLPFIKDKIVLVGYLGNENNYGYDIEDKHYTPMNEKYVGKSPPDTFGIVIHANIIQMLLTNNYIKVVPNWVLIILMVVLTYFALAYFIYLNKRQLASYILRLNLVQLLFIVVFTWISLLLYQNAILFKITTITATVVFSLGLIGYYKKLAHYSYKKYKWEGYFYHD